MNGIPYDEFVEILEDKSHPLHKEYKGKRQIAKALTFAILYGSSPNGIALNLNISREEAERLVALYFDKFPLIKQYIDDQHQRASDNHYVWSGFNQRKMEYGTLPCFKRTAVYNAALRNSQNVDTGIAI